MNNQWKYVENLNAGKIKKLEDFLGFELPSDYKEKLPYINRGKPEKYIFKTGNKECVLDYMIDIDEIPKFMKNLPEGLIPFATDPFGNFICFKYEKDKFQEIVFYDHETDKYFSVTKSFSDFLESLY